MDRTHVDREHRLPMFVQVTTTPALADCWSVNISQSGLGLVAAGGAGAQIAEGDSLGLALELPTGAAVRARGTVMWLYARPARSGEGTETAIGVRFTQIDAADRPAFDRYLLEHQFRVVVALASPGEEERVRRLLGGLVQLHFERDEASLVELLGRGDVSALVAFGAGPEAARLVARVRAAMLKGEGARVLPPDLLPSIIFCAPGGADDLVRLFNAGHLFRALVPPWDDESLRRAVEDACNARGERTEQRRAAHALERALLRQHALGRSQEMLTRSVEQRLVHASPLMRRVLDLVRKVAPHKVSVLLQGETGTGKEVLATLIHELSPRAQAPFVIQDCGVLTATLLDSELFGHVKGSFTGAVADKPGLFVVADGGTIFLDEIENTTPDLQAKLLRVLEDGTVRPVGGTKPAHVDVRVIAASNRPLADEVAAGRFRQDLFYRLNAFPVRVPPLRERVEDILPLAEHFLMAANAKLGLRVPGFTEEARRALCAHPWPGNIRELRNAIECAVLLGEGHPVGVDLLPDVLRAPTRMAGGSLRERVRDYERELIRAALATSHGVLRRAARELRASVVTVRRKAIEYGLTPAAGSRRR